MELLKWGQWPSPRNAATNGVPRRSLWNAIFAARFDEGESYVATRKASTMLNIRIHQCGDTTILRCDGGIVAGDESAGLWTAVVSRSPARKVILDLEQVDRMDAAGLGLILRLLLWSHSRGIDLKLMNVTSRIERLLKITHVNQLFAVEPSKTAVGVGLVAHSLPQIE